MIGTIICIAHRGGGEGVFENRRETIKKTLQNKLIDAIEIDLRCTKDGVLVAHHDRGVYINGDRVWIDKVEFASMKHLGIPRFEEILLLTEASGKILNIDVKDENCIDPLVQFFKKKPSKQKIYFDCFNLDVLLRLEEELDNGEYYLSLTLKDSRDLNRRFFVRMIALLGSIFFSRIILFLLRRRVKEVKV
ncbi:MAG: glycerophosphodiester phosphodiesterase, partial [Candidatus Paceibacterota bacterium]